MARRVPLVPIALLGFVNIAAYGAWYYAFGILLDPIIVDTGWSEGSLAAIYSVSIVLTGLGSLAGGRLLDRFGNRLAFLLAAVLGGSMMLIASAARNLPIFGAAAILGGATFGALGFYHITQTVAVRIAPRHAARAIAHITIYGAFASVIFLPAAAALVEAFEWRWALRIMTLAAVAAFAAAAAFLPTEKRASPSSAPPNTWDVLRTTMKRPAILLFLVATGMTGFAIAVVLVYQVPVMVSAGLSLSVAATVAAARGFAQLIGRLPIAPTVARFGARRTLIAANLAIAFGSVLLLGSGSLPVALGFAVVVGTGIGAYSPLQGIYGHELFDRESLGTLMGLAGLIFASVGGLGPVLAGVLAETTGSRDWAIALIFTGALGAALALAATPRAQLRNRSNGANSTPDASIRP